jgi:uncharacterized C2H2 Zn-finger protein
MGEFTSDKGNGDIICDRCNLIFVNELEYVQHYNEKHKSKELQEQTSEPNILAKKDKELKKLVLPNNSNEIKGNM